MKRLLKSDLYRASKDKSLYVALILFAIYAVLLVFINIALENVMASAGTIVDVSGKVFFKSSISLIGDFGMLLPIFIATFVVKDFRFNTVRNKIAMGYKKWQIYVSALLSAFIVATIILSATCLVATGFSSILNGYGPNDGFMGEFGFIIIYFLISLLLTFITLSIVFVVTVLTGSTGLAVASALVLTLVFQVLTVIAAIPNANEVFINIMSFTNYGQSYSMSSASILADLTTHNSGEIMNLLARILISTPIALGGINALGIWMFKKIDLK